MMLNYLSMLQQKKIRTWRRPEEERQSVYDAEQNTGSCESNEFFGCM